MISNVSPMKKEFNETLTPLLYDQVKSAKLLADAGWTDSNHNGTIDKELSGKRVEMNADLFYLNTSPDWKNMAMLIAESFEKAGIKINAVAVDINAYIQKAKSHDFDLLLGSWGGSSLPEDYTQLWHSESWKNHGSNYSGFGNPASDALIDSISMELDESKRFELSKRFQQMIYDDQPLVFLYCNMRRNVIHKRFGNVRIFADRPGVQLNMFRLLSTNHGITMEDNASPH